MSAGTLYVAIKGDTKDLVAALKKAKVESAAYGRDAKKAFLTVNGALESVKRSVIALGTVWAGVHGIGVLKNITDKYTLIDSKLKLVTKGSAEFNKTYERLYKISQVTGTSFSENAAAFTNLAINMRGTGVELETQLDLFETFNKSLIVNGSSQREAAAATLQFKQAMSTGILAGEEFRGVSEGNAYWAKKLADALGMESVGALRELSRQQKLTSDVIISANKRMMASVDKDFANVSKHIDRALNELQNAFEQIISDTNRTVGGTNSVATAISELATIISENKDEISDLFVGVIKAGGLAVTAISKVVDAWKYLYNISDAQAKGMGFAQIMGMSADELQKALDGNFSVLVSLQQIKDEIASLETTKTALQDNGVWNKGAEARLQGLIKQRDTLKSQLDLLKQIRETETQISTSFDASADQKSMNVSTPTSPTKSAVPALKEEQKEIEKTTSMWDEYWRGRKEAPEEIQRIQEEFASKKLDIEEELTDKLYELTHSETENAIYQLDKQLDGYKKYAANDAALAKLISDVRIAELDKISEANKETTDSMSDAWKDFNSDVKSELKDTLADAFKGEFDSIGDAWDELMDSMADKFAEAAADMAIDELFSDSGGDSDSGGLWDTIATWWENWNTGGYLSPAGTKYYADGGGVLSGGSGVRDDLYLGKVGNNHIQAMGGEFIVNRQATAANLGLLKDINDGNVKGYATGGNVGEYMADLVKTNNSYLLGALHFISDPQSYIAGLFLEMIVDAIKWGWNELTDNQSITQSFEEAMASYSLVDEDALTAFSDSLSADLDGMATSVDIDGLSSSLTDGLSSFESTTTSVGDALASDLSAIDASLASWAESDRQLAASMQSTVAAALANMMASSVPQNSEAQGWPDYEALDRDNGGWAGRTPLGSANISTLLGDEGDEGSSAAGVGSVGDHSSDDTHAAGGVISSVYRSKYLPDSGIDDGYAKISIGEGVIDKDTMKILSSQIRSGGLGGGNITVKVYLNDKELKTTIDDVIVSRNRRGANPKGRAYI